MSSATRIEWTERTWNPVVGCSLASPGCTNCYAMRMAYRLSRNPGTPQYHGTASLVNGKPVFTGKLELAEKTLLEPLKRRTPTTYFVNSMGDLFHEDMPEEWIDRVFAVMALCPQHRFQVLTKRAERMRDYVTCLPDCLEPFTWSPERLEKEVRAIGKTLGRDHDVMATRAYEAMQDWPLPNVWLGVSVEDQRRAEERVPQLLQTPAAIRFVSAEPLLGPVDPCNARNGHHFENWLTGTKWHGPGLGKLERGGPCIDQVIVGGESGPNARPMHPDWARRLRDQCKAAGTAFFFKQWGECRPGSDLNHGRHTFYMDQKGRIVPASALAGDFPDGSSSRDGWAWMRRVGKKVAGRLLDGREHNGFPDALTGGAK